MFNREAYETFIEGCKKTIEHNEHQMTLERTTYRSLLFNGMISQAYCSLSRIKNYRDNIKSAENELKIWESKLLTIEK